MAIKAQRMMVEVDGDTSKAQDALGDLEREGAKVPNWVGKSQAALAGLFGIGVAAGGAFTVGLMGNIDAADASAKVSAQLGLTEAESARIGGVAGDLFANAYGESIGEVNAAVASVVSSVDGMRNASAPVLEAATADVLNFASAFEQDVPRVAQIAGQAVRQGLVKDFDEAMDLMTVASQQVPEALRGDLLDAADEYGGFFASLGFSGEEAFAALARGAETGMYGIDKTGDALKELTIRATDGSKATTDAYDAMGLSSEQMAADILAGGDTARGAFDKIVGGLLAIKDPQEQANAAIALMGTPLEDLGTSEIPAFLASLTGLEDGLGKTEGAAGKMGETLNSGPGVALETFKRQAVDAFMGLTDWALPPLMTLLGVLADEVGPAIESVGDFVMNTLVPAFQSMAQFVQENSTVLGIIAGIIATVFVPGLIAMGVQSAIAQAKVTALWVTSKAQAIASVAAQSLGIAKVVAGWVLMGAQALLQGARIAAGWVLAMGPIGWIIAAVVGLVALIVANWDTISEATTKVWGAISEWISDTWESIQEAIGAAVEWVRDKIDTVMGAISKAWNAVWNGIKAVGEAIWKAIRLYVTTYIKAVSTVVTTVLNTIKSIWNTVWNGVKSVVTSIWNGIKSVVSGAVNNVLAIIDRIKAVGNAIGGFFRAAKDKAVERLRSLVDYVKGIPGKIVGIFTGMVGTMKESGRKIIGGLIDGVKEMAQKVKDAVGNVLQGARNLLPFSPAKEGPFSGKGWALYSGRSIPEALAEGIRDRARDAVRAATDAMAETQGALTAPVLSVAGGAGGRSGGVRDVEALTSATGVSGPSGVTFQFHTYNPVAEPQSVTTNKAMQRVGAMGWGS